MACESLWTVLFVGGVMLFAFVLVFGLALFVLCALGDTFLNWWDNRGWKRKYGGRP